jgi:V/A-type H+-transporting ATPase subunit C
MRRASKEEINPLKRGASLRSWQTRLKTLPNLLTIDRKRIRPFHETTRYGFAVGRIRVLETQLLSANRLERLVEADYEGALNILDEVAMGDYLAKAEVAREVDSGLTAFLRDIYASMAESLPRDSCLLDFFLCRYDFHNLKSLLKASLSDREPENLLEGLGLVDIDILRNGIQNPEMLASPYRETVTEVMEREAGPQEMDTIIDRHYLQYRLYLAAREDSPFILHFARSSIDLANLKTVIRARNLDKSREFMEYALVEGGFISTSYFLDIYGDSPEVMTRELEKTRYNRVLLEIMEESGEITRLTEFDRRSDDYLMDLVRGTKRVSVGVEPIFAYVQARENELMLVRIILMAKLHNISPADIEKMLRKLYID